MLTRIMLQLGARIGVATGRLKLDELHINLEIKRQATMCAVGESLA